MGIRPTTHLPANALDRDFRADPPNAKWVAGFTYVWTAEGWLYVTVVLDLFSRRVVGWSMRADMTSELVMSALMMAIWRRGRPKAVLHHSDRGSQYGSEAFQRLLGDLGVDIGWVTVLPPMELHQVGVLHKHKIIIDRLKSIWCCSCPGALPPSHCGFFCWLQRSIAIRAYTQAAW